MNRILLLLFLVVSGVLNAQVVTFADPDFKQILVDNQNVYAYDSTGQPITIDQNNDGEIQISEAIAIWRLRVNAPGLDITSVQGIESFTNLRLLDIEHTSITSIDVSALTYLEEFVCGWNQQLSNVNLTGLVNLRILELEYDNLQTIDISGLPDLEKVILEGNSFTSIIVGDLENLNWFNCAYNGNSMMIDIEVGYLPNLERFEAYLSMFETLDLSGCPALNYFEAMEVYSYLNLRNGNPTYEHFHIGLNMAPDVVCIDEGEEQYLENLLDLEPDMVITTYCTYTPGGNYNTISGTLTFDGDGNGCGAGDNVNSFIKVNISDGTESGATYTNAEGVYNFYTQIGTFTITPQFENDWFVATPASATIILNEVDNSTTMQNFCVTANGVHPDVEIVFMPLNTAEPGFETSYKIVYKNKGNQTVSGAVALTFDDALIDFVEAYPVQTSQATGQLTWNYSNLLPFESRSAYVTFNVNSPQETPPVEIDDVLAFSVSITPTTGDETPSDNTFAFNHVVTGSFDPNDITCLEGNSVIPDKIGEYLHYNINFENTGNAAARFIVVKDVIDETQFDISTLQVLDASHAMHTRVEGNEVEFYFDDINLGASEKGNVVFKIKTLNTLQVNDDVTQQANIFFDYNWPIETNEATTVFAALSTGNFELDASVKVYPNPSKGIINISADSNVESIELYDIQGRLLQSKIINETEAKVDISQRTSGMYFVKVTTEAGTKVEKIVKE
jgi:hypothetical protein